jgi:hypothetical protein
MKHYNCSSKNVTVGVLRTFSIHFRNLGSSVSEYNKSGVK